MINNHLNKVATVSPGIQLQFLRYLLMGLSPNPLMENLQPAELASVYGYIWEKSLEIGIRVKGDRFSQSDVIKRLKSVEQFKLDVGCAEPGQQCISEECFQKEPDCVKLRLKEQFNRLYNIVSEYFGIEFKP